MLNDSEGSGTQGFPRVSVAQISLISKEVSFTSLCNAQTALGSLGWSVLIAMAKDKIEARKKTLVFRNRG